MARLAAVAVEWNLSLPQQSAEGRALATLRWLLAVAMAVSGAAIVTRAAAGPFHFLLNVNRPLVAEGVFALAATLLLLTIRRDSRDAALQPAPVSAAEVAAVLLLTAICLYPLLRFPLVCDEYVLAAHGRAMDWAAALSLFRHAAMDPFFRPLADLSLPLDAWWAGASPAGWHALGFALHLINTLLVFALASALFGRRGLAFWAAALFGIHGSRPEAVAFLGRFDQLATLFVLAGLLLFDRYLRSDKANWLAASNAAMLAGLLSKESAYIFPLLAIVLVVWRGRADRRGLRATLPFFAIMGAVFAYRWQVLGGIGGYADLSTGHPQILNIHMLALLKAMTMRLWGLLYFPINWSYPAEWWLAAAMAAGCAGVGHLVWLSRGERRALWFGAAFTMIASLPVAHMLLIGADLRGAAHLYLPSVGFCFLAAAAIAGVRREA
ncbi:MAG: hypothetical protein ACRD9L_10295, partial [Bryobacteraceae bacterium]